MGSKERKLTNRNRPPPPGFFGSADSKGVRGANRGSVHSKGVSRFERLLTEYYTTVVNWCQGKSEVRGYDSAGLGQASGLKGTGPSQLACGKRAQGEPELQRRSLPLGGVAGQA